MDQGFPTDSALVHYWESSYARIGTSAINPTGVGPCTLLRSGQLLDMATPNQYGVSSYLWSTGTPVGVNSVGTTLNMFDALTGTYILSIVNGTSPTLTEDDHGDLIGYYINATAGTEIIKGVTTTSTGPTLNMWNSTAAINLGSPYGYTGIPELRIVGHGGLLKAP